jgi:hypothetical protein
MKKTAIGPKVIFKSDKPLFTEVAHKYEEPYGLRLVSMNLVRFTPTGKSEPWTKGQKGVRNQVQIALDFDAELFPTYAKEKSNVKMNFRAEGPAYVYVNDKVKVWSFLMSPMAFWHINFEQSLNKEGFITYGMYHTPNGGGTLNEATVLSQISDFLTSSAFKQTITMLQHAWDSPTGKTSGYKGNPDGRDIYPVEVKHGYGEPLAGGTDVMRKLQNLLLTEQGSDPRPESSKIAVLGEDMRNLKRLAMEFPTEKAKKKYLKEHPKADPSNHTVEEKKDEDEAKVTKQGPGGQKAQKAWRDAGKAYKTFEDMNKEEQSLRRKLKKGDPSATAEAAEFYSKSVEYAKKMNRYNKKILDEIDRESLDDPKKKIFDEALKKFNEAEDHIEKSPKTLGKDSMGYDQDPLFLGGWVAAIPIHVLEILHDIMYKAGKKAFLERLTMEFPTEKALKDYLKEHPKADPSNHTVTKKEETGKKDTPKGNLLGKDVQKRWKDIGKHHAELMDTAKESQQLHEKLNKAHHDHEHQEKAKELEKELKGHAQMYYNRNRSNGFRMMEHVEKIMKDIDRETLDAEGKKLYDEAKEGKVKADDLVEGGYEPRKGYEASDFNYMAGMVAGAVIAPLHALQKMMDRERDAGKKAFLEGPDMKNADWQPGKKDEEGWEEGKRVPDTITEGEGSLIPNILERLAMLSDDCNGLLARYEEGVPADPTENMSPEDAKEWKEQNEEHRDEFKKAFDALTSKAQETNTLATLERLAANKKAKHRSLSEIADEITRDWPSVNYAAKPYLNAMKSLDQITETYGQDPAKSIVAYFLSNATSWKGEKAKAVKAELKALLKIRGASEKTASDNTVSIMKEFLDRDWPAVEKAVSELDWDEATNTLKRIQGVYHHSAGLDKNVIDMPDTKALGHIRMLLDAFKTKDEKKIKEDMESRGPVMVKEWKTNIGKYKWQAGFQGEEIKNLSEQIVSKAFSELGGPSGWDVRQVFFKEGPEAAQKAFDAALIRRHKTSSEEDGEDGIEARYEEGVPADPTENMTEEDAKEWRLQNLKNKDNFKGSCVSEETDGLLAKYEEGKPADPTENMTEEDAKKWKNNTEEHKNEFKKADSHNVIFVSVRAKKLEGLAPGTEIKFPWKSEEGDLVTCCPYAAVVQRSESSYLTRIQERQGFQAEMILTLQQPPNLKNPARWEKDLKAYLDSPGGTVEILKNPRKPTIWSNGIPITKTAATGPDKTGRNWMEFNEKLGHWWAWNGKPGPTFRVTEVPGPGIPLYQLQMLMDDGKLLKFRHQEKDLKRAFTFASAFWKTLNSEAGGLIDLTHHWSRIASNEVESRFEEGVPADPTENMTPEDKAKWEAMNEEHRDEFKTSSRNDTQKKTLSDTRTLPERKPQGQPSTFSTDSRLASAAPSGLYGHTKRIQADCEACIGKLSRAAERIAKNAWRKDEQVAPFLAAHAKRSGSLPAAILVDAMTGIGPKIASNTETVIASGTAPSGLSDSQERLWNSLWQLAVNDGNAFRANEPKKAVNDSYDAFRDQAVEDLIWELRDDFKKIRAPMVQALQNHWLKSKKAGSAKHGLYGFSLKTSTLGMSSCTAIHELAGHLAADLHSRRADRHANITDFFKKHGKETKCARSRLLLSCYPDAGKTASVPNSVEGWLKFDV